MQEAEVVLGVLRERGRKGLPLTQLYRQMFNRDLYLLAYGNIYSNKGAMTPGASAETADGMSEEKIEEIIGLMRHERYRFSPAAGFTSRRRNGKLRPLGLPSWSDKLVGEVVRLLLEAYYEPGFSDLSHGFRKGQGCHTALRKIHDTWTGTTWFIEGDIWPDGVFYHLLRLVVLLDITFNKPCSSGPGVMYLPQRGRDTLVLSGTRATGQRTLVRSTPQEAGAPLRRRVYRTMTAGRGAVTSPFFFFGM